MVAMQIEINGRGGVILLDPGYQVGRVITVMIDQQYPHTGKLATENLIIIDSILIHVFEQVVLCHHLVRKKNTVMKQWLVKSIYSGLCGIMDHQNQNPT